MPGYKSRYRGYGAKRGIEVKIVPDAILFSKIQVRTETTEQPKNHYDLQLPCKLWIGATIVSHSGYCYGVINTGHKVELVHRVVYRCLNGQLEDNVLVLHKCDMPLCVEGTHLYKGTAKENTEDSIRAGTHVSVTTRRT